MPSVALLFGGHRSASFHSRQRARLCSAMFRVGRGGERPTEDSILTWATSHARHSRLPRSVHCQWILLFVGLCLCLSKSSPCTCCLALAKMGTQEGGCESQSGAPVPSMRRAALHACCAAAPPPLGDRPSATSPGKALRLACSACGMHACVASSRARHQRRSRRRGAACRAGCCQRAWAECSRIAWSRAPRFIYCRLGRFAGSSVGCIMRFLADGCGARDGCPIDASAAARVPEPVRYLCSVTPGSLSSLVSCLAFFYVVQRHVVYVCWWRHKRAELVLQARYCWVFLASGRSSYPRGHVCS